MSKKILGPIIGTLLVIGVLALNGGKFAVNEASAEGELVGVSDQFDDLRIVVSDLSKKVTDILPLI